MAAALAPKLHSSSKFTAVCAMSQLFLLPSFPLLCSTSNNKGAVEAEANAQPQQRAKISASVFQCVVIEERFNNMLCHYKDFLWWSCSFFCRCDVYLTATRPGGGKKALCICCVHVCTLKRL